MKLLVISHKNIWRSDVSPSGYATDGGFPIQMRAIAELFDETELLLPCLSEGNRSGELPLTGERFSVRPFSPDPWRGVTRRLLMPFWVLRNLPRMISAMRKADALHIPIPGDIQFIAVGLAVLLGKKFFVRHCGNWFTQRTLADRLWKRIMIRFGNAKRIMFATGGALEPPSKKNPSIRWIFSSSLTREELETYGRRTRTFNPSDTRFVLVGRQDGHKGTDLAIRAVAMLKEEYPGMSLDVVGEGSDLDNCRQLANELGVPERIRFHGRLSHDRVMDVLQKADVFCFPTLSEGFPKALLEALACGLPIVATPVSVIPLLVADDAGVLLPERTAEAVTNALRAVLRNPATYARMSACARARAQQYSLERWRESIGEVLEPLWGPLKSNDR